MKKVNFIKFRFSVKSNGSILAELMFGLSISLLTLLCISIITLKFDAQKKSDTSLNSTISSASSAILTIRQDAKNAGYGLTNPAILGCKVNAYNSSLANPSYKYDLYPVKVDSNSSQNNQFDSVSFMSSSSELSLSPATIVQNMPKPTADYFINSHFGFNQNDFILLSQPNSECTLAQVTNVNKNKPYSLEHSVSSKFNSGSGNSDIIYLNGAKITNLGLGPQTISYSVDNNRLIRHNTSTGEKSIILENVYGFKTLYGIDTGSSPKIKWTNSINDAKEYNKVVAIKVGIMVRSPAVEDLSQKNCQTTIAKSFDWYTDLNGKVQTIDVPNTVDAACYRYRVFSTTVPLRNVIWSPNIK